jgi:hypothetical protein
MLLQVVTQIDDHNEDTKDRECEAAAARERVERKLNLMAQRIRARLEALVAEQDKKNKT